MFVKSLKMLNFRSFSSKNIDFDDNNVVIINGPNAIGKTTILEAIYCLSLIKSFRTQNQNELISYESDGFYIDCVVKTRKEPFKLSLSRTNNSFNLKYNNERLRKCGDFIGKLSVVLFSSTDFLLMKGGPKERRKIFDLTFCQLSSVYYNLLVAYNKIVKDRNYLLKKMAFIKNENSFVLLESMNERLVTVGNQIFQMRKKFIKEVERNTNIVHQKITNSKETINLVYCPSIEPDAFLGKLKENLEIDIKTGHTNCGIHRDDFKFILNDKDVTSYGSQGQQRNVLLSCKLGMAMMLYDYKKETPIILLDDVFSELDHNRQNAIFNCLDEKFQTIITAASLAELDEEVLNKARIIKFE